MSEQPSERSKITPNTFQNPNVLVDRYMRWLDGDEVKCYIVVVRKTFGWMKQRDRIAKSQIKDLTGLSDSRVDDCMKTLVLFGLVLRTNDTYPGIQYGAEWSLQLDDNYIDEAAMQGRWLTWQDANKRRAEKMRAKKAEKNAQDAGGVVAQTGYVAQDAGGVVAQTPQKPLSKASINNNKENESIETSKSASTSKFSEQEISNNLKLLTKLRDENLPGMLTPIMAQELAEAAAIFPGAWYEEAFKSAVLGEARNWKYIRAILQNRLDGKEYQPKRTSYAKKNAPAPSMMELIF